MEIKGIKRNLLALTFLAITVLLSPFSVLAKSYDFFVDASYDSGDEDGSEIRPFNTIGEAVEAAMKNSSGARNIYVKNGTYGKKATLGNSVNLYGESRKDVVITDTLTMKNDTEIKNLTIGGGYPAVMVEKNTDVLIEDCDIRDFSGIGIQASPGSGSVTIKNNNIYNGKGGKGIYIQEGRRIEISGNNIHDNGQEGMDVRARTSGVIEHNSITGNGESGIEFIIGSSKLEIRDNTIKSNGASAIASQFYKGASKGGKIKIINNTLSKNKKFGLDCAIPSGGDPSPGYWNDSIEMTGNTIEDNKIRPISKFCKIIEAVEEEQEKEDNKISETALSTDEDAEEQKQEDVAVSAEEEAAKVAEQEKMAKEAKIRIEMEIIGNHRRESNDNIARTGQIIQKRNRFLVFLIGPDFSAIKSINSELEKMRDDQNKLRALASEAPADEIKSQIREMIVDLSRDTSTAQTQIYEQEGKFSLFGWLVKTAVDRK